MNRRVKTYASENVIEEFYSALADGDSSRLERVHIPRSDVFYVRQSYFLRTGNWETLDRIERCMYLEGHLSKNDIFKPDEKRDWE